MDERLRSQCPSHSLTHSPSPSPPLMCCSSGRGDGRELLWTRATASSLNYRITQSGGVGLVPRRDPEGFSFGRRSLAPGPVLVKDGRAGGNGMAVLLVSLYSLFSCSCFLLFMAAVNSHIKSNSLSLSLSLSLSAGVGPARLSMAQLTGSRSPWAPFCRCFALFDLPVSVLPGPLPCLSPSFLLSFRSTTRLSDTHTSGHRGGAALVFVFCFYFILFSCFFLLSMTVTTV
ncbi:hypothetical protein LX36DRAFT_67999 [Colletotrichum falcatum]|nr:hypothetical protein LX36DRAFT_67999 [Colletotrichum falcatum]